MGKYKQVKKQFTVAESLDIAEIETLRDEMAKRRDNMDGTGLENTRKYESVSEAAETLDNVDSIDFDDLWTVIKEAGFKDEVGALTFKTIQFTVRSRRQLPSRPYRLSNAIGIIYGALDCLEAYLKGKDEEKIRPIQDELGSLRDAVGEIESVKFPGMFG